MPLSNPAPGSNIVALDPTTITALLEPTVSGTVALDSATLAALENINALALVATVGPGAAYTVIAASFAPASAAQDTLVISGSATKTVKIRRIEISATATTATVATVSLLRRSTQSVGGTATALSLIPADPAMPAPSATAKLYTVNPTTSGTFVGVHRIAKLGVPLPTGLPSSLVWDFEDSKSGPLVLRGVAQNLAINLNGGTFAGGSFCISCDLIEE